MPSEARLMLRAYECIATPPILFVAPAKAGAHFAVARALLVLLRHRNFSKRPEPPIGGSRLSPGRYPVASLGNSKSPIHLQALRSGTVGRVSKHARSPCSPPRV